MSLRFFADHCISTFIIQSLENEGYKVFRLRAYIPSDSTDKLVISKAQEIDSILISLNVDFTDIVSYPPAEYKGVISLQVMVSFKQMVYVEDDVFYNEMSISSGERWKVFRQFKGFDKI